MRRFACLVLLLAMLAADSLIAQSAPTDSHAPATVPEAGAQKLPVEPAVIDLHGVTIPPPTVYPGGQKVDPPRVKYFPDLAYPASVHDVEGVVVVQLVINEKGKPVHASVLKGLQPDLDNAAIQAAMNARFFPTVVAGKRVKVQSCAVVPVKTPIKVGPGVTPPQVVTSTDPVYTDQAAKSHLQGTVVLSAVVNEDGTPSDIHVVKSLDPGLDANAVDAVQHWRFKPAMKDGKPAKVRINVEVTFRL